MSICLSGGVKYGRRQAFRQMGLGALCVQQL